MNYCCEYCKREFAYSHSLRRHYTSCKEKKQNEQLLEKKHQEQKIQIIRDYYEAEIQNIRDYYETYIQVQREQYDRENQELREELSEFKMQIFEIAKQPQSIIHNNQLTHNTHTNHQKTLIVQHLAPLTLTREKVIAELQNRDSEALFRGGANAFKEFVIELLHDSNTGKPMIMCTDAARRMFIYIDEFGEIQKDVGMQKVHTILSGPLKDFAIREYIHLKKLYPDQADSLYKILKQIEFQVHDINKFADNEFKNLFEKSKFQNIVD